MLDPRRVVFSRFNMFMQQFSKNSKSLLTKKFFFLFCRQVFVHHVLFRQMPTHRLSKLSTFSCSSHIYFSSTLPGCTRTRANNLEVEPDQAWWDLAADDIKDQTDLLSLPHSRHWFFCSFFDLNSSYLVLYWIHFETKCLWNGVGLQGLQPCLTHYIQR